MKLIFTLFFHLIICLNFAQYAPILKGKASCARFLKSTTCVVLTEDEAFNKQLISSFELSWTITPVKFITEETFASSISDTKLSFVSVQEYNVKGEKKEIGALALFNGGFTDTDFYLNSSLAYVAYDNWGIEKSISDIQKRLPAMVYQLQETISLINEFNIEGNNEDAITRQLNKIYNARTGVLKTKTLLIDKKYQNLKIISVDEFAKLYKYAFEFVSSDEIMEAIDSRDPNKAVLFSSFNLHKYNQVLDCSTLEIIFSEKEVDDLIAQPSLSKFDAGDIEELYSCAKRSKAN